MASTTIPTSLRDPAAPPLPSSDGEAAAGEAFAELEDRVLVVGVAGRRVAIPLARTREVIRARTITRVPGAPAWVIGLLNVRGAVMPVGGLRVLHGRARTAAREGLVVIVEDGGRAAGLRVAEIVGVHATAPGGGDDDRDASVEDGGGLPLAGLARLTSDAPEGAEDAEGAAVVPLLDVAAVLDALLDHPGDVHP